MPHFPPAKTYARKPTNALVDLAAALGPTVEDQLQSAVARAAAAAADAAAAGASAAAAASAAVASARKASTVAAPPAAAPAADVNPRWNHDVEVLVTGTAAGLPSPRVPSPSGDGGLAFARNAFDPLNLQRLVFGENCIDSLTPKELAAMVSKLQGSRKLAAAFASQSLTHALEIKSVLLLLFFFGGGGEKGQKQR
jgi:hypothetical protein